MNRPRKFEAWFGGTLLGEIDFTADEWASIKRDAARSALERRAEDLLRDKMPAVHDALQFSGALPAVLSDLRIEECQILTGADGSAIWLTTTSLFAAMTGRIS